MGSFIAPAGAIRKPSPGAARAQKLIDAADNVMHRSGSFASAVGCLQADVHTLCDELATFAGPGPGHPTVQLGGMEFFALVEGLEPDEDNGSDVRTVTDLWINGGWVDVAATFGDAFAESCSETFQKQNPIEEPEPEPEPDVGDDFDGFHAARAEDDWIRDRDMVASQ